MANFECLVHSGTGSEDLDRVSGGPDPVSGNAGEDFRYTLGVGDRFMS